MKKASKGYNDLTWVTTARFLLSHAQAIYEKHKLQLKKPVIAESNKGSLDIYWNSPKYDLVSKPRTMESVNGSIDIDWETPEYGLIVNIKENGKDAFYFGDVKLKDKIRGNFNPQNIEIQLVEFLYSNQKGLSNV